VIFNPKYGIFKRIYIFSYRLKIQFSSVY